MDSDNRVRSMEIDIGKEKPTKETFAFFIEARESLQGERINVYNWLLQGEPRSPFNRLWGGSNPGGPKSLADLL
jgi:hypothetical protein